MDKKLFNDISRDEKKKLFDDVLDSLYTKKSSEWTTIQNKKVLQVFKTAVKEVSAYGEFLKKSKIDYSTIQKSEDFYKLPAVTKKNYLRAYPWKDLCKKNYLTREPLVMTSTSGSTGEPFYFPRTGAIDVQSSVYHQMFLRSSKLDPKKSTLVIDCFGMGVWIGGLITYQAFKHISNRGYPMTIITPGITKREIFQAVKNCGHQYDQIIMCGYPPFIKDVIDDAEEQGIQWADYSLKIIFAAEGFSETFRDYILKKTGIKDVYRDTMNIYGSADLGTMAQETPLCILVRKLALVNPKLYVRLFGQATRLPTLAQYIPEFVTFDAKNNSLYCTGDSALPLVRYEIGDNGGVMTYETLMKIFKEEGVDIQREAKNVGILDTISELPFVYIYERSDFAASLYGAIIYPEFIKKGLLADSVTEYCTGKFTMFTKNDADENQYLEIHVEMKHDQKATKRIQSMVLQSIHSALIAQSTEYKKLTESLGDRILPKLVFWPHGHEAHFLSGAKQKWVKK